MRYQSELNDVLNFGGYLNLGRCGWSLSIGERPSATGLGTISSTLSGYYNIHDECPENLIQRCIDLGIPVIDSRKMTLEQAFEYIKGPLIHCSKTLPKPDDKITLNEFKEMKKHLLVEFINL